MIEWYRTLIAVRKAHPDVYDGRRIALDSPEGVIAAQVGDDLAVCANPTTNGVTVELPQKTADATRHWAVIADSTDVAAGSADGRAQVTDGTELSVPARTFVVVALQ